MLLNKGVVWNAIGNIIYLGCQWIITVLVTRLMGYEEAGVFSLAMSVSVLFQTIALFGIRGYQVSDVEGKYQDSIYVGFRGMTCATAMMLCMIFSFINRYSGVQLVAIFLFMCFRLAEDYSDVLHGIAQKNDHLDIAGKGFALKGIISLGMFSCGCYFFGLRGGMLFMVMGSWGTTIMYDFLSARNISVFRIVFSFKECLRLGKEAIPLCMNAFLMTAISVLPKYVLEKMCGEEVLGIYSSIFAPALLIQAAVGYIYNPFTPRFAELFIRGDYDNFYRLGKRFMKIILGAALVAIILVKILGKPVLFILFGESILEYTYLLMPILVSVFTLSLLSFFGMLGVVIRDFKGLIRGGLLGVGVCGICLPPAVNLYNMNGASIGLIIGVTVASIYVIRSIYRNLKERKEREK